MQVARSILHCKLVGRECHIRVLAGGASSSNNDRRLTCWLRIKIALDQVVVYLLVSSEAVAGHVWNSRYSLQHNCHKNVLLGRSRSFGATTKLTASFSQSQKHNGPARRAPGHLCEANRNAVRPNED